MKSIKKYVVALAVIATGIGMVGCTTNVHEHTFSEGWENTAEYHWHKATCEHSEEVSGRAAHDWNHEDYQYDSESGRDKRTCTVCHFVDEKDHSHGSTTTWTKTATTHEETYDCCGVVKTAEAAHAWDNEDYLYDSESGMEKRTCSVCGYMESRPKGFVIVTGGTVTGAVYSDNYTGVFPEGRTVKLSSFFMGKYEVTQAQYKAVMAGQKVIVSGTEYALVDSPSACNGSHKGYQIDWGKNHSNHPVDNITWYDAVYYCNALSKREKLEPCYSITVTAVSDGHIIAATVEYDKTKNGYRLPTEAEWEYAARGGDPTLSDWNYTFSGADKAKDASYDSSKNLGLDSVGWYSYNNKTGKTGDSEATSNPEVSGTHEVGMKKANRLGIYDMSGNVWEWCYDWFEDYLGTESVTDPAGAASGSFRVVRGGGWSSGAGAASVSYRYRYYPSNNFANYGFRVCRSNTN